MTFSPAFSRSLHDDTISVLRMKMMRTTYPCKSSTLIVGSVRNFFAAFWRPVFWSMRRQEIPRRNARLNGVIAIDTAD